MFPPMPVSVSPGDAELVIGRRLQHDGAQHFVCLCNLSKLIQDCRRCSVAL